MKEKTMIRKYRSPILGHVRVVFELPSSVWADRISLTGDFNNWRENDIVLQQTRSGVWQAAVDFPLGARYQFRYVVDGQWRTDSHADGMSDNSYGSQNSLIIANLPENELLQETPGLIRESRPLRPFSPTTPPTLPQHTRTPAPLEHPVAA
jgi:1,4-alpha-glucan branching enzyme